MREVEVSLIAAAVRDCCIEACCYLPEDVREALVRARDDEPSELGREVLDILLENAAIAAEHEVPICQDTGLAVVFVELGQDVRLVGGDLGAAVDQGVREGYAAGYLRKSVVGDPLQRVNTGDNTPAMLTVEIVPGDEVKIIVAPKGAGSENMSALAMLTPADGADGVKAFVVERVIAAGANPCPPIIVGVGIGGTMDKAALLAKKALLRPVGQPNPKVHLAELESAILKEVNASGIGPQGLGGRYMALAVSVETAPAHIASLPVAINIQCHAARHAERVI